MTITSSAVIAEADRAYSVASAAKQLDVSRATVYRLISRGVLRTVTYPHMRGERITSKELARFLNSRQRAAR